GRSGRRGWTSRSLPPWVLRGARLQDAAADLVFLDTLEQGAEVALAETFIALALDELEEDRPDYGSGETLEQHFGFPAFDHAFTVDQDAILLQLVKRLAVTRNALIDLVVIGIGCPRHEFEAVAVERFDRNVKIVAAERHV